MAKYLVTGGAGFIGSHIVKKLLEKGAHVRIADNLSTGKEERLRSVRSSIEFLRLDLAEPQNCDKAVAGIDHVLHQAAIPSVQRSLEDPVGTNRANISATVNLLESSRRHGVRRFVFAASSSAYGNTEVLPKHEEMPANPISPYALQKYVGERYCRLYYDLFGLETVALRYFNIFGPEQDPNSEYSAVIPKFITRILEGKPVVVYGDGEQSRDFTYVENVVHANLLAVEAKEAPGKVFNVGCGARITLNRLIQLVEGISRKQAKVEYAAPRKGDVRDSLADIGAGERVLGYRPQVLIEEGLRRTVEAFSVAPSAACA